MMNNNLYEVIWTDTWYRLHLPLESASWWLFVIDGTFDPRNVSPKTYDPRIINQELFNQRGVSPELLLYWTWLWNAISSFHFISHKSHGLKTVGRISWNPRISGVDVNKVMFIINGNISSFRYTRRHNLISLSISIYSHLTNSSVLQITKCLKVHPLYEQSYVIPCVGSLTEDMPGESVAGFPIRV
jgi:hypothetical protein